MDFFSSLKALTYTHTRFLILCVLFFLKNVQNDCFEYANGIPSYNGTMNVTISGIPCLRWDSDVFSTQHIVIYPMGSEHENYCRNPDGYYELWCYTTDPNVRWEKCDIQECENTTSMTTVAPTISTLSTTLSDEMNTSLGLGDTQYCLCPCDVVSDFLFMYMNLTEDQKYLYHEGEKERLRKESEVNTKVLSSHVRRRTSAKDNRLSSISMGATSVVFLLVVISVIVISDIPTFLRHFKPRWRTCKCKCKRK